MFSQSDGSPTADNDAHDPVTLRYNLAISSTADDEEADAHEARDALYATLSPRSRRKLKNRDQMRVARVRERETMDRLRETVERLEAHYRFLQDNDSNSNDNSKQPKQQHVKQEEHMIEQPHVATETLAPLRVAAYEPARALSDGERDSNVTAGHIQGAAASSAAVYPTAAQYSDLIALKSQFQEENFRLKQILSEKDKHKETLERFVSDFVQPTQEELHIMKQEYPSGATGNSDQAVSYSPAASSSASSHPAPGSATTADYVPMSHDAIWTIIGEAHRRMASIQQAMQELPVASSSTATTTTTCGTITMVSSPACSDQSGCSASPASPHCPPLSPPVNPLPPFCGWEVRHYCEENQLRFCFEKPFAHVSPCDAMARMWANEMAMQSYRDPVDAQHQTMWIVQQLNDDIYLLQRRVSDPATHRSVVLTYLRFRLRTPPSGFLIGMVNIGGPRPEKQDTDATETQEKDPAETVVWGSNLCVWTEFVPMDADNSNARGCCVRITGTTNLDSPTSAHRNVANVIIGLLRWENLNIGPMFTLTDR